MSDEYEQREKFLKAMKKLDNRINIDEPLQNTCKKTIDIGNKKPWEITEELRNKKQRNKGDDKNG